MRAISEYAALAAMTMLNELPPSNELTYNQRLQALWECIVLDVDRHFCACCDTNENQVAHRYLRLLLRVRPLQQKKVQQLCEFVVRDQAHYTQLITEAVGLNFNRWTQLVDLMERKKGA